jgi:hypothetical protein
MYTCLVDKRILSDEPDDNNYAALCYALEITQSPELGQEL